MLARGPLERKRAPAHLYEIFMPGSLTFENVPRFTEDRIRQLCSQALAAGSDREIHTIAADLRLALEEHIRRQQENLKVSVTIILLITSSNDKRK
jgi:hypothetical protein